jgi:esterase/lipase superfamily enzyme
MWRAIRIGTWIGFVVSASVVSGCGQAPLQPPSAPAGRAGIEQDKPRTPPERPRPEKALALPKEGETATPEEAPTPREGKAAKPARESAQEADRAAETARAAAERAEARRAQMEKAAAERPEARRAAEEARARALEAERLRALNAARERAAQAPRGENAQAARGENPQAPPSVLPPAGPAGEPQAGRGSQRADDPGVARTVRVFYGTDRKRSGDERPSFFYSGQRGTRATELGICTVSIPPGRAHEIGNIETPFMASIPLLNRWATEDPQRHVMITGLTHLTEADFVTHVRYAIAASPAHDAFVFVHGYNNTFADGCKRTAQIAYDLGFQGAPILYSWPSAGAAGKYLEDDGNAEWTLQQFESFLMFVATKTNARAVHLVAHSTGARVLAKTLASMAKARLSGVGFQQAVLAAADVDASDFASQYLPAFRMLSKRTTLYVSSTDEALRLAKRLRNYPRAGEAGDSILVIEGVDTIDVSPIDTSLLGHSYLTTRPVFQDLLQLLRQGRAPTERCAIVSTCYLETLKWRNGLEYWRFLKLLR